MNKHQVTVQELIQNLDPEGCIVTKKILASTADNKYMNVVSNLVTSKVSYEVFYKGEKVHTSDHIKNAVYMYNNIDEYVVE